MITSKLTFSNKTPVWVHKAKLFADLVINRFIFSEIIQAQVLCQTVQLFFTQRLSQKGSYFLDFSSQILCVDITSRVENCF